MKLSSAQFDLLAKFLIIIQGNVYDVAKDMFGEYPSYAEYEIANELEKYGIFICHECDRWKPSSESVQHPFYTKAICCVPCRETLSNLI